MTAPAASSPHGIGDRLFRWVVSIGTGLAFAGMLASLAVIERGTAGKLVLRWHWAALPLTAAGIGAGLVFWRLVWRAEREGTSGAQRTLRNFSILLGVMAVTSFAYPMRFIQEERRNEVFLGLGLAVLVLSTFGFLIWKTIQWVNENEPRDGESEAPDPDR